MAQLREVPKIADDADPRVQDPRSDSPALLEMAPDGVGEQLITLLAPTSFEADQYRVLRHRIESIRRDRECRVIGVTSAVAGEGKTTTAINLAGALSQSPGARVLLVDVDLRLSGMSRQLGLEDAGSPGLTEAILDEDGSLEEVVRRWEAVNLSVLPGGRGLSSPPEALQSSRFGTLLAEARQRYEFVILDAPPLLPVPDSRLIARWVDGFLVIVAAHVTTRRLLEEALRALEPDKVLGLVFNGADRPPRGYYGYYHGFAPAPKRRSRLWGRLMGRMS